MRVPASADRPNPNFGIDRGRNDENMLGYRTWLDFASSGLYTIAVSRKGTSAGSAVLWWPHRLDSWICLTVRSSRFEVSVGGFPTILG